MAACAFFACILSAACEDSILWLYFATFLLLCAAGCIKKLRPILVPAFCVFALFVFLYSYRDARPSHLPTGKHVLTGTVCDEPMDQTDKHRTVITLDNCVISGDPVEYKVRLYVYRNALGYEVGDELFIRSAKLSVPNGVTNPDGFDFNAYLWRSHTALTASVDPDDITLRSRSASLKRSLLRIRRVLSHKCDEIFAESSDVIKAVLLGDRSSLSDNTYDDFTATGISHLIALSGLHVSALALMLEYLLKKLHVPRVLRYGLSVIVLCLYAIMTGASNSTIRAVLMYSILCITRQLGYYSDTMTRLCAALLIQLGCNPLLIHDNGFILSYASVAAILCFSDFYILHRETRHRALATLLTSAKTSFSVQIVSFPLLAGMFYRVPLLSVPANVVCVPLAVLALYASVVILLLGCISVQIAGVAAYPVVLIWRFIKWFSAWIAGIPIASLNAVQWPAALACIFVAVIVLGCVYVTANKWRRRLSFALLMAIIAISLIPPEPINHLKVTFLSVGEADSAVFDAQGNVFVLDCGKDNGIAADYLTGHGANVRGLFITHADTDHCGGSKDILKRYPNATVYLPFCWDRMNVTEDISNLLYDRNTVYLKADDVVEFSDDIHANVLWPPEDFEMKDDNSGSLILDVVYNDYSVLMMADLANKYDALASADADLVKVAHHGSKNATSEQMLQIVTPDIAVISVGNNGYGHPAPEVLERLEAASTQIYRTDESGAIIVDIFEDGSALIDTVLSPEE